jgi:hypothetical protein
LGSPDLEDALSKLGSKAEVLDADDGKALPSSETGKQTSQGMATAAALCSFYWLARNVQAVQSR